MVILNSQLYLFKIMTVYANYGETIILLVYLPGVLIFEQERIKLFLMEK